MGVRVGLQEPSPLMREGLRLLFDRQTDLEVAVVVAKLEDLTEQDVIDVIVINAASEDLAALSAAIAGIRDCRPSARVVGIHNGLGPTAIDRLRAAGLDAVVDGAGGAESLLATVRDPAHMTRRRWVPPTIGPPPLTERELRVLELLSLGLTASEIALRLEVATRTVETTKRQAFEKLGVQHQSHAVAEALRLGLLPSSTVVGAR